MIQVKPICDQIDRMFNMGFLSFPYTVCLNDKDYEDAWKDAGYVTPANQSDFYISSSSGGIYFQRKAPDYTDGHTYYYYKEKQSISDYGVSFGHELQVIKIDPYGDWKRYDHNGAGIIIPYYIKEKIEEQLTGVKTEEKIEKKTCWHTNKKAVYLFVSAYWMCEDCGADIRTLTEEEFYKELKGR